MARLTASLIALALGAFAASALSSCGEDDANLLRGETAREITANLDAVKQLADEGDCLGAESAARQVSEQIEALDGVDQRLMRALGEGATRLNEVVASCEEATEAIAPATVPTETETSDEDRKDEKYEEKEEKKEEKQEEKEDEDEETADEEPEQDEAPPSLPPQANGEAKGPEGEVPPSGGVSPGSPAGEGD